MTKIEIKDAVVILDGETVYLDKGGAYADVEGTLIDQITVNYNFSKMRKFKKAFAAALDSCTSESERIDTLVYNIPTDFCECSILDIENAFKDVPEELKSKVVLANDDHPNDDGFVSHYWTMQSDIMSFPYFSAFALVVELENKKSMQSISLRNLEYKKEAANRSVLKAQKDLAALKLTLEGCTDEAFIKTKLKAANSKLSKAQKELEEYTEALQENAFDANKVLSQLKELAPDAPEFLSTVESAVKFLNDLE